MIPTWKDIKKDGQPAFKTGEVEPIDLYKAGNILHDGLVWNMIKLAYRSRRELNISLEDMVHNMTEVIHYANIMLAYYNEKKTSTIETNDVNRIMAV